MKLSIALTTYNHENYIAKALESIVNQHLNFDYEIVIGNDCSTDNTQKVINEYKNKYPDIIRQIEIKTNLGYIANFDLTMQSCLGDYIAIFDGDDIMIPEKLIRQVEYLDNNPDCALVGHKARAFHSKTGKTLRIIAPPKRKNKYTINDLIYYGSFFANSSKMFRKSAYPEEGIDTRVKKIADWYITIEIAKKGKIGFIDEVLVEYRVHDSSIMQTISMKEQSEDILYILDKFRASNIAVPAHVYRRQTSYAYLALGIGYLIEGRKRLARRELLKAIKTDPFYGLTLYKWLIKTCL